MSISNILIEGDAIGTLLNTVDDVFDSGDEFLVIPVVEDNYEELIKIIKYTIGYECDVIPLEGVWYGEDKTVLYEGRVLFVYGVYVRDVFSELLTHHWEFEFLYGIDSEFALVNNGFEVKHGCRFDIKFCDTIKDIAEVVELVYTAVSRIVDQ
jgi:hypothetical protein